MDQHTEVSTINNSSEKFPIKTYSLDDLKVALGINSSSITEVEEIADQATDILKKAESDLQKGFYSWVVPEDTGHKAIYNTNEEKGVTFTLIQTLFDGVPRYISLTGNYTVGDLEISTTLDSELIRGIKLTPTCRVSVAGALVSERTSPSDITGQQASAFLRNLVAGKGEDTVRLDLTINDDRSPYPFVAKMLNDFQGSIVDEKFTSDMFNKMSGRERVTVGWVKDYSINLEK